MKKTALIIISALLLAACGGPEKPKNLLSKEEMENIMFDISMLQSIRSFAPQKLSEYNINAGNYIFKKYKTDSLTLAQNQLYYAQDLETYKKMQDNVMARMKAELEKITGKKAKPNAQTTPKVTSQGAPPASQTNTTANRTFTPSTPQSAEALKRRRDSIRGVAQRKLQQAPKRTVSRE